MAGEINSQIYQDWSQGNNFSQCMLGLFERQLWTDVTIRWTAPESYGNHVEEDIKAHKIVLASRSPVFRSQFFGPNARSDCTSVDVRGLQGETLTMSHVLTFLRCAYGGSIDDCENTEERLQTVVEVLKLAHFYQIADVVDQCCDHLKYFINTDNAFSILELCLLLDLSSLRERVCFVIDSNAENILNSSAFLHVTGECLSYVLAGNTFNADEALIFEKVLEWATKIHREQSQQNSEKQIKKVYSCLRPALVEMTTIVQPTNRKEHETRENILGKLLGLKVVGQPCFVSNFPRTVKREVVAFNYNGHCETRKWHNLPIVKEASCAISIHVPEDIKEISIVSINLGDIRAFEVFPENALYEKQLEDFLPCQKRRLDLSQTSLKMTGSFTCSEIDFSQRLTLDFPQTNEIGINYLCLNGATKPYNMLLKLQFELHCPDIQIYSRSLCTKVSAPFANGKAKMTCDSGNPVLISCVTVDHASQRDANLERLEEMNMDARYKVNERPKP